MIRPRWGRISVRNDFQGFRPWLMSAPPGPPRCLDIDGIQRRWEAGLSFAYIFDVDGVLLRTMKAHFACYKQALAESNVPIDKAQFYTQAGMTGQEQIKIFR